MDPRVRSALRSGIECKIQDRVYSNYVEGRVICKHRILKLFPLDKDMTESVKQPLGELYCPPETGGQTVEGWPITLYFGKITLVS